jgi:hypothetical protein
MTEAMLRIVEQDRVIAEMKAMLQKQQVAITRISEHFQSQGVGGAGAGASTAQGVQQDPWAAAATASQRAAQTPTPNVSMEKTEIDLRGIESIEKFGGVQSTYEHWKGMMFDHMARGRPVMTRLIEWAQKQKKPITEDIEQNHVDNNLQIDVAKASGEIWFFLSKRMNGDMDATKRNIGAPRGLELWRNLYNEYEGTSASIEGAQLDKFLNPQPAHTMNELNKALNEWEALGKKCKGNTTEAVCSNSLCKLLPSGMREKLIERTELSTYADKLNWVRTHAIDWRNNQIAKGINDSTAKPPKKYIPSKDDMEVGAVEEPEEWTEEYQGIWYTGYAKGNPKGWSKGKGNTWSDKGQGKGNKGQSKGDGKGKSKFEGNCYYCEKPGHRANECWARAAAGQKGKGKGVRSVEDADESLWVLSAVDVDPALGPNPKCIALKNRYDVLRSGEEDTADHWPELSRCRCEPCERVGNDSSTVRRHFGSSRNGDGVPKAALQERTSKRFRKLTPAEEWKMGISPLYREEIETINLVAAKEEWKGLQRVDILVDSGAVENVAGPSHMIGYPILESEGSRNDQHYLVADGGRIPNYGEQKVKVVTEEGHLCGLTFQLTDVTRPILSVGKMTDNGHDVTFNKRGGTITNGATGQVTKFNKMKGNYIMTVWLKPAPPEKGEQPKRATNSLGFARQAQ